MGTTDEEIETTRCGIGMHVVKGDSVRSLSDVIPSDSFDPRRTQVTPMRSGLVNHPRMRPVGEPTGGVFGKH